MKMFVIKTLENWFWDACCKVREPADTLKYKYFISSLILLKRLSDVYNKEIEKFAQEYKNKETLVKIIITL
jgi:type I restriction-modification system DNA methylase subunit